MKKAVVKVLKEIVLYTLVGCLAGGLCWLIIKNDNTEDIQEKFTVYDREVLVRQALEDAVAKELDISFSISYVHFGNTDTLQNGDMYYYGTCNVSDKYGAYYDCFEFAVCVGVTGKVSIAEFKPRR